MHQPAWYKISHPCIHPRVLSEAAHTCDYRRCGCIDDGGVVVRLGEGGRHRTLDAQHLPEGVLIAMRHLQADGKCAMLGLKLSGRHLRRGELAMAWQGHCVMRNQDAQEAPSLHLRS